MLFIWNLYPKEILTVLYTQETNSLRMNSLEINSTTYPLLTRGSCTDGKHPSTPMLKLWVQITYGAKRVEDQGRVRKNKKYLVLSHKLGVGEGEVYPNLTPTLSGVETLFVIDPQLKKKLE